MSHTLFILYFHGNHTLFSETSFFISQFTVGNNASSLDNCFDYLLSDVASVGSLVTESLGNTRRLDEIHSEAI